MLRRLPLRLPSFCQRGQRYAFCSAPRYSSLRIIGRKSTVYSTLAAHATAPTSAVGSLRYASVRMKAMAPESQDMLSTHAQTEVDVIVEGTPLDGDR